MAGTETKAGAASSRAGGRIIEETPSKEKLKEIIANTPPSGKKRSLGALALVATFGSFLFGYDTGVIAGALPFMEMPYAAGGLHLTTFESGFVGGLLAIGAAFGAILGGYLSDHYGRRHNITMLAGLFVIGTIGCTLSINVWMLYPFRFILGWAVGGASATVPVYLAENAPKRIRGPLVAMDQFMIVFGQLIAYAANAVLSNHRGGPQVEIEGASQPWTDALAQNSAQIAQISGGNGEVWRWMLILATIPAVALWIGIRMMPESGRWYAANGHFVEATGALKRIRHDPRDNIELELEEMADNRREEAAREKWGLKRAVQTKWTRKIIIIGCCLGFFDQLTGINTAMYYLPTILRAAGFSAADAITLNVVTGTVAAIGAGFGLFLVGRFMRRHVGMYQEGGITISLCALSLIFAFGIAPHINEAKEIISPIPTAIPWAVVVFVSIFVFMKQSGTVNWILVSELFPARIRGVAQGLAVGALWLMNSVVTTVFPVMIKYLGGGWTYTIFTVINFVAFLFYWKVVPETKNSSLEELEVELEERYS